MPIPTIILILLFLLFLIWSIYLNITNYFEWILPLIGCGIIFLLSLVIPVEGIVTVKSAISTRVQDEIIVQCEDFPTRITDSIEAIDKPLKVVKELKYSMWGYSLNESYTIKINK